MNSCYKPEMNVLIGNEFGFYVKFFIKVIYVCICLKFIISVCVWGDTLMSQITHLPQTY